MIYFHLARSNFTLSVCSCTCLRKRCPDGILPDTVRDITSKCTIKEATSKKVTVELPCDEGAKDRQACVIAAFTHLTPDVFAPHLLSYQREIFEQYADAGLAGTCKDEWGFPRLDGFGCPEKNDYWYSRYRSKAYTERTGGRDLVRDCLLMYMGERGRERERQAAINHFMRMSFERNVEIETDYYKASKEVFGPNSYVGTHPTWYPYPGFKEFKKNGLDWWQAPRDFAQTDEATPFSCRTSLAKKWGGGTWHNMYYSSNRDDYERAIWSHALGGGRMNFHPILLHPDGTFEGSRVLLRGDLMRGYARIRLLDFISNSPLDCPVAVIFGHTGAMNWAGPAYDDVGIKLTNKLWEAGFPADLIPASEIGIDALKVNDEGFVQYGPQRYAAVVLYHPQFEGPATAAFFAKAARGGKTALYRMGDWTADFETKPFDGNNALPGKMIAFNSIKDCSDAIISLLNEKEIDVQTQETISVAWEIHTVGPGPKGKARLIDGTEIIISGKKQASGDPIQGTFDFGGYKVTVDAVGVVGVRFAANGKVRAIAAGGLKAIRAGSFDISLSKRADIALWYGEDGRLRGVLQDWQGPVPTCLKAITSDWLRLCVPEGIPEEE